MPANQFNLLQKKKGNQRTLALGESAHAFGKLEKIKYSKNKIQTKIIDFFGEAGKQYLVSLIALTKV